MANNLRFLRWILKYEIKCIPLIRIYRLLTGDLNVDSLGCFVFCMHKYVYSWRRNIYSYLSCSALMSFSSTLCQLLFDRKWRRSTRCFILKTYSHRISQFFFILFNDVIKSVNLSTTTVHVLSLLLCHVTSSICVVSD